MQSSQLAAHCIVLSLVTSTLKIVNKLQRSTVWTLQEMSLCRFLAFEQLWNNRAFWGYQWWNFKSWKIKTELRTSKVCWDTEVLTSVTLYYVSICRQLFQSSNATVAQLFVRACMWLQSCTKGGGVKRICCREMHAIMIAYVTFVGFRNTKLCMEKACWRNISWNLKMETIDYDLITLLSEGTISWGSKVIWCHQS